MSGPLAEKRTSSSPASPLNADLPTRRRLCRDVGSSAHAYDRAGWRPWCRSPPSSCQSTRRIAMKSYDLVDFGAPLQVNEKPTPKPQGSEVLLRTLAAGVCHSDLHIWDGWYDL